MYFLRDNGKTCYRAPVSVDWMPLSCYADISLCISVFLVIKARIILSYYI